MKSKRKKIAPEFPTGMSWLNSEPLTLKRLRGKVILLNFWSYACIDCQRGNIVIRDLHAKYTKKGLVIINVFTPEFEFEKSLSNIEDAVSRAELEFPVVVDSQRKIWDLYQNHWRPRIILINKEGEIVYDYIGYGKCAETEMAVQSALREIGAQSLPEVYNDDECANDVSISGLYMGYVRGQFANHGQLEKDMMQGYTKTSMRNRPILEGQWKVTGEYAESGGGALYVPLVAREVNVVMESNDEVVVDVTFNGIPLKREELGNDIQLLGKTTTIKVSKARIYNVILADEETEGMLQLNVPEGVKIYMIS